MNSNIKFIVVLVFALLALACLVTGVDRPYQNVIDILDKDSPNETTQPLTEEDIFETEDTTKDITEDTVEDTTEDTEMETEPVPFYSYTDEELDLLARLIYSEGGIESYQTQLMIGSVVMNRVMSDEPYFPDTIREVIYQKNQFSVTFILKDGIPMIDHPADEEAKRAAYEVLTYGSILPPDVQVFFHKSITTGWVATREPYGTFDHTTFAYIYERGAKQ